MPDRLIAAARAFRRAKKAYEQTQANLHVEIVAAADDGAAQVDIVKATGYTREHIRRLVEDARRKRAEATQS